MDPSDSIEHFEHWFRLSGDSRLGRCATENCGGQPTWRLEAGGIGSNYCSGCQERIRLIDAGLSISQMKAAIDLVVSTFKKDEAQGFRSRDRQFAISILDRFASGPEKKA